MERRLADAALARLEAVADVITGGDMAQLPGVEAVIVSSIPRIDGAFMDRVGPSLKVVARPGIGVDNIDIPAATERGILVINTPEGPTESTAEHAVALLLALSKRVVLGDRQLRGEDIARSELLGTEGRGRTLGVVGFGRIGRRVAEICALGLKMRVLAYDPYADPGLAAALGVELVSDLDELLRQADFVTLHPALTPETYHLIGERELRLMKRGAYLINVSRGAVVDEAALIRVLEEGHLAGAALDVFDPEPPSPDNPLLRMRRVVATPHIGSFTDLGLARMGEGVVDQLLQIFRGERPTHLLNPEAWPGRIAAATDRGVAAETMPD